MVLAGIVCAVAIAACGSSGPRRSAHASPAFALAKCMRAHGGSNFPDPTGGLDGASFSNRSSPGSSIVTINGITFSGPAFQAAVKACKLFGGGSGPPPISEHQKLAELAFAACMRKHGVANFPDPTFGPGGHGIGWNYPPGFNRDAPLAEHASAICNTH